ncbi:alpha/beta hydrolase [Mycolicibacterium sp. HS_4_1]
MADTVHDADPADDDGTAVAVAEPSNEESLVAKLEEPPSDWWVRHYTFFGTAVGLVFVWLSMTPSLLPRGPLFQGIVSGAAGACGYGLGVLSVWLVRYMRSKDSSPKAPRWAWLTLIGIGAIGQVLAIIWFHVWQDEVRDMMGVSRMTFWDHPLTAAYSILFLFGFVEIGQLIRKLVRFLVRQLERIAPPRVSGVVAVLLIIVVVVEVFNGVGGRYAMSYINQTFASANDEDAPDNLPPTTPLRSGGPGSLTTWSSLGRQGRIFVGNGPSVEELSKFNGSRAIEPIRAYAGLHSADSIRATAKLAAQELKRTGGLERAVVAVATTTGTGWINEAEAASLEYMYNGNTAIVSMQYSFLPSWISFLVDKANAQEAGQDLFEEVDALVRQMPEAKRPKLVVFGESLGSFGAEAPFQAVNNLVARTNGALFSGPTFNNPIWTQLTRYRDAGSPEKLPIYDHGRNARFASRPEDLNRPADAPWDHPRVVYLQHASDPIAWWNPDLLFARPDWLDEPRGRDVSPRMEWIPVVTFLQVSADMAVAVDVPDGHGHVYVRDVANAWAAVLQPPGWTPEKTERLRPLLHPSAGT